MAHHNLQEILGPDLDDPHVDWVSFQACLATHPEEARLPLGPLTAVERTATMLRRALRKKAPPAVIHDLIAIEPRAVGLIGSDGSTALEHVVGPGKHEGVPLDIVRALVEAQPDLLLVQRHYDGETALHGVCSGGAPRPEIVRVLVDACPDAVLVRNRNGETPLHLAVRNNLGAEIVQILLAPLAVRNQVAEIVQILLNVPLDIVRALVEAQPDLLLVQRHYDGETVLHGVCSGGAPRPEIVRVFVDACADAVLVQNRNGETPLHLAVRNYLGAEIVQILLNARAEAADLQDCDFDTPLHLACKLNLPSEIALAIIAARPEAVTVTSRYGDNALHLAVCGIHLEVVRALLDTNAELANTADESGFTPNHIACMDSSIRRDYFGRSWNFRVRTNIDWLLLVRLLLGKSPPSAWLWSSGVTPLHHFCNSMGPSMDVRDRSQCPDIMTLLLKAHPEAVTVESRTAATPIHILCNKMSRTPAANDSVNSLSREMLMMLVRCPAIRLDCVDMRRRTWFGKRKGSFPLIHAMIELGCPVAIIEDYLEDYPGHVLERDDIGRTPLMVASAAPKKSVSPQLFQLLLSLDTANRAPGMADAKGRLPLHVAAENGKPFTECIEIISKKKPKAIATRDTKTHLYPFMLAAVEENSTVSSVYGLLKEAPHLVMPFSSEPSQSMLAASRERDKETERADRAEKSLLWRFFGFFSGGGKRKIRDEEMQVGTPSKRPRV